MAATDPLVELTESVPAALGLPIRADDVDAIFGDVVLARVDPVLLQSVEPV